MQRLLGTRPLGRLPRISLSLAQFMGAPPFLRVTCRAGRAAPDLHRDLHHPLLHDSFSFTLDPGRNRLSESTLEVGCSRNRSGKCSRKRSNRENREYFEKNVSLRPLSGRRSASPLLLADGRQTDGRHLYVLALDLFPGAKALVESPALGGRGRAQPLLEQRHQLLVVPLSPAPFA